MCATCDKKYFSNHTASSYYDLSQLLPDTKYSVKVSGKMRDSVNFGNFSGLRYFTTKLGDPKQPYNLRMSQRNKSRSLSIEFDYPCPLTGTTFKAKYVPINNISSKNVSSNSISVKNIELVGLEDGHQYTISIEACINSRCQSSTSQKYTMSCGFQETPTQPMDVQIDQKSKNAILKWNEPNNTKMICIKEYKIQITKHCPSSEFNEICECKKQILNYRTSPESKFEFDASLPGTNYSVKIAAQLKDKQSEEFGEFSDILDFMTRPGKPNKPDNLTISLSNSGNVLIEFEYPCPLVGDTVFQAKASSVDNQTLQNVNSSRIAFNILELSGLLSGKHFVWIEACINNVCNQSASQEFFVLCEPVNLTLIQNKSGSIRIEYEYPCPSTENIVFIAKAVQPKIAAASDVAGFK